MSDPISYAELGAVLAKTQFGVSASDLHGSLAGFLCGGGQTDARRWLAALELDPDDSMTAAFPPGMLERLYNDCAAWLADPGLYFEPLLPPASAPLAARIDALVEWCRGFLGGIGLAGAGTAGTLSAEAKEILSDFDTIAATRFEYADSEEDENALTEVVEFIRVGALLLHTELSEAAPLPGTTLH